jgi:integrase
LNIAIREYEWISTNIAATISRPPLPPPRQRYLSDAERSRLLAECRRSINQHLYALVLVALNTSLRRGSLFALTTKNTDVRTGTISLEITKNGRGVVRPLVGEALEIVRRLATSSKDGYLFPRGKGDPWCHYRAAWEHAVKRANISGFTFHCLRHTTASYLAQCGVPLFTIGGILGHADPRSTARYAHLQTDTLRDALEHMTKRISS